MEINGTEYFFDGNGIMSSGNRASHAPDPNNPKARYGTTATLIGYSNKTGTDVKEKLRQYFASGTYDLLRKNCNCFSDCALWYCCKIRLASNYRSLENKGKKFPSLVKQFGYEANPKADSYDHEGVIMALDPKRVFKETKGYALTTKKKGAGKKLTPEELRAKRLAAMGL